MNSGEGKLLFSGNQFIDSIAECGALPGIKVDRGRKKLGGITNEFITVGLDSLEARCEEYYTAELIALDKAVKAAMVRAGTAREADFGEEVPAFDLDATAVEPEFQKLYSYLFDFENMGYNAEEADRPMPTAIFIVNFDKETRGRLHISLALYLLAWFENIDVATRLLIPIIVLQNHNRYNIMEKGQNSIDIEAIEAERWQNGRIGWAIATGPNSLGPERYVLKRARVKRTHVIRNALEKTQNDERNSPNITVSFISK
ncbi:capsid protein [Tanacetum coccineum]